MRNPTLFKTRTRLQPKRRLRENPSTRDQMLKDSWHCCGGKIQHKRVSGISYKISKPKKRTSSVRKTLNLLFSSRHPSQQIHKKRTIEAQLLQYLGVCSLAAPPELMQDVQASTNHPPLSNPVFAIPRATTGATWQSWKSIVNAPPSSDFTAQASVEDLNIAVQISLWSILSGRPSMANLTIFG